MEREYFVSEVESFIRQHNERCHLEGHSFTYGYSIYHVISEGYSVPDEVESALDEYWENYILTPGASDILTNASYRAMVELLDISILDELTRDAIAQELIGLYEDELRQNDIDDEELDDIIDYIDETAGSEMFDRDEIRDRLEAAR